VSTTSINRPTSTNTVYTPVGGLHHQVGKQFNAHVDNRPFTTKIIDGKQVKVYQPVGRSSVNAPTVLKSSYIPNTNTVRANRYSRSSSPNVNNDSQYSPVQVIDRKVHNGVVQPVSNYSSVNNGFKSKRTTKLDTRRGTNSRRRSYLVGKQSGVDSKHRLRESLPEQVDENGNSYFSIYGRGQNFDSKKLYDIP
jgi:hypothetical protein